MMILLILKIDATTAEEAASRHAYEVNSNRDPERTTMVAPRQRKNIAARAGAPCRPAGATENALQ